MELIQWVCARHSRTRLKAKKKVKKVYSGGKKAYSAKVLKRVFLGEKKHFHES